MKRKQEGCLCGTGSYCHKHLRYKTTRTCGMRFNSMLQLMLGSKKGGPYKREVSGGGVRILRRGVSGDH